MKEGTSQEGLMKNYIYLFFFIACLFLLISCNQQKSEWAGKIEVIDGITVVKNPKEPIYQEEVLSIEEELSIGYDEEDENYMFSYISHITVDGNGRIYVLDRRESHVKLFDQSGEYIRTIGRAGQGPGEFNIPVFIYYPRNELLVMEFDRLSFFSPEGKLQRVIPMKTEFLSRARCDSQGNIITTSSVLDPENPYYVLKKFDSEINLIKEIIKVPMQRSPGVIIPFSSNLYMTVDAEDNIIFSYSKDYEIQVFNPDGDLTKKIKREYEPVEITDEEKEEITRGAPSQIKYEFPKAHPPYQRFVHDEMGRLYVQSNEKGEGLSVYYYDVFNREGQYIVRVPLRQYPVVFQGGKLYSLEESEDGYQYIKRYKVTWNIEN